MANIYFMHYPLTAAIYGIMNDQFKSQTTFHYNYILIEQVLNAENQEEFSWCVIM